MFKLSIFEKSFIGTKYPLENKNQSLLFLELTIEEK